jgi:hypothetical protein
MEIKVRPNRRHYLEVLKRMTPSQRLQKTMELSNLGKELLRHGLRRRFPGATEAEIHKRFLERLAKCHNRNY